MSFAWFLLWLGLMFPLAFSAGPNNLMCASCGAAFGFRKCIPMILGINAIIALYSVLIGMGIGEIFIRYPQVMHYVKIIGSLYILYLAYGFVRTGIGNVEMPVVKIPGFWTGVIINALNPKCVMAIVLMYSQMLIPGKNMSLQVTVLTILTMILSASAHITLTFTGSFLTEVLKTPRLQRLQHFLFAGMLVVVAIWLFL